MQIRKQVFDLLISHDWAKAFHLCAPVLNNVGHAIVVGGKAAEFQILPLENALHAGAFLAA